MLPRLFTDPALLTVLNADGKPLNGEASNKEIRAHLDRHSQAMMKDFYSTSEFCGACHKAALPKILNGIHSNVTLDGNVRPGGAGQ